MNLSPFAHELRKKYSRRKSMLYRSLIGTVALAAGLTIAVVDAQAFDQAKYPDWAGAW
jgi:hypothetical protein